ncbi:unnamed protein product [Penicillium bialowiezense]
MKLFSVALIVALVAGVSALPRPTDGWKRDDSETDGSLYPGWKRDDSETDGSLYPGWKRDDSETDGNREVGDVVSVGVVHIIFDSSDKSNR